MSRAAKSCRVADCPHTRPCPVEGHEPKPWQKSNPASHRTVTGRALQERNRYILEKYETFCHVCGGFGGDEVDHVIPLAEGGADDVVNLRPIHSEPCHRQKTAAEAERGRRRRQGGTGVLDPSSTGSRRKAASRWEGASSSNEKSGRG